MTPTSSDMIENLTFDELKLGHSAKMLRTLTHADIQAFAAVSGDTNPTHLDAAYADASMFHSVIAHGMWGGALISALLGTVYPGPGTIYLEQNLHFRLPMRVGDTLEVTVTVVALDADTKCVELECVINNQKGERVLDGVAKVLAPTQKMRRPRAHSPSIQLFDPQARLQALLDMGRGMPAVPCAIVHPCDAESLRGAIQAAQLDLIVPYLVGPEARIRALAETEGIDIQGVTIHGVEHSHAAAEFAAQMAADRQVQALMKGSLHTDELIHAVLAQASLRTGRRLSHVFRFDVPSYAKPLLLTDAALNITPTLSDKVDIVQNAIDFARLMGVEMPKVAILAAVETVTPSMQSTIDAAALCKMAQRGQIKGGLLDGPLAFDNAISPESVRIKHIESKVAGDADVLVVPDLESGNMLAKLLEYLAGATTSGLVLGARVPIALTSRADTVNARIASALLAKLVANHQRQAKG